MGRPLIPAGFGRCSRLFGGLTLFLLLAMVGCSQSNSPTNVSLTPSVAPVDHAFPRNHVPKSSFKQLVYVMFTQETTYEQAEQVLHSKAMSHYPMVNSVPCGNIREIKGLPPSDPVGSPCPVGTAMTTGQLQADFSQSHRMLVVSRSWEKLNQLATDARVVSLDPYPLP
jgi:hypothetical protein